MKRFVFLAVFQLGLILVPAGHAAADDVPADARKEIDQFQREAARIGEDADAKIEAKKADLVERLKTLQTKYTKQGKLDEAVAIRDRVRQLEGGYAVEPDRIRRVARPVVDYRACQKVQVEWGGSWWAAEVLKVRGNQYFIHYTGWSCSWDEWVPECRIRPCVPCRTPYRR
jgi:hypothetical protein